MAETLTKLRPDRDLQCYFQRPSAVAALSETSASGFTVSGSFRQQFDWAVVEWNRDNVFEHPALRCLPDGDLSGLRLSYDEERVNCMAMDCTLWPTVEWPFLRIWATGEDGIERLYRVPLREHATPLEGEYRGAEAVFELGGMVTGKDYLELAWEAGDGVSPWDRHATHMLYGDQSLEDAVAILSSAIAAGTDSTGMTAEADGRRITLRYKSAAGANGNRVGVYANVSGANTETWSPGWQTMSGGTSPTKWRVSLDFSNLEGYIGPEFTVRATVPTPRVRKMRWTWAPEQPRGEFARTEFSVTVSNWSVGGTNVEYRVAGPGSRRVEDDSETLGYSGAWREAGRGNYSGGSIRMTDMPGASVSLAYTAEADHTLYLGTRKLAGGAQVTICFDGETRSEDLAIEGEDALVRINAGEAGPGEHTIAAVHAGGGPFYFDFFEIAVPAAETPTFPDVTKTTLATDWDTDHSIALAPERTAWLIKTLGFGGRANHYAGAMWFYELVRPGHQYASATVTFTGAPDFGGFTTLAVSGANFQHLNLVGDTAESVAKALELAINAGATAIWASAAGGALTIRARAMGAPGNGVAVAADTGSSGNFIAQVSGPLTGAVDGDTGEAPWACGWRTDVAALPRMNRAARDWHRSFFEALRSYGIQPTAGFSLELQHGDGTPEAGMAQRYPDGKAAYLNTPALQTNFSPASREFWKQAYLEMADLMAAAGAEPYLQFGEVQWWYFASDSGMPFYDDYTKTAFQARYGRPMAVISSENATPALYANECAFLPALIGEFTAGIADFVRQRHPRAQFETLYPPDVNDTALNRMINWPSQQWTPSTLACLKTENFTYTGDRDLNKARESIGWPVLFGFPPSQTSHLVGIGDYTSPWQKERRLAFTEGAECVVLFALDQFCLIGYGLPLERGQRRAGMMGT